MSNNTESNSLRVSQSKSLTPKTRFLELFIENKNLIKQGLYLLEICQIGTGSTYLTTDRHGLHRPILVQFLLLLSLLPSTASMTDRHRHNSPSRVFVPKHLNSWNMGTGFTSLNFMTNLHDRPSQTRRTVMDSITPHLVRLSHLLSADALRCHLQTVTSMTDRHNLYRWSLLHFFSQNLRIHLWTDSLQIRRNLYKNQHKKDFGHTKLKKKY